MEQKILLKIIKIILPFPLATGLAMALVSPSPSSIDILCSTGLYLTPPDKSIVTVGSCAGCGGSSFVWETVWETENLNWYLVSFL